MATQATAIEREYRPNDHRKESNMKRGRWILLALLVVFAFPVSLYAKDANPAAAAKATITEFTGTEIVQKLVYPGDLTFTPGGTFRGRDRVWEMYHHTTDPRVTGTVIVVSNGNFNPQFRGPCWGTMHVKPDGLEGAWEAVWHSPPGRPEIITAVGHGTGELEGLKAWWTFEYDEGDPNGHISGRILDPHGE
jgi:hypothetical protein